MKTNKLVILSVSLFLWSRAYQRLLVYGAECGDAACAQLGQQAGTTLSSIYPSETFSCSYSVSAGYKFPDNSSWIYSCASKGNAGICYLVC